MAKPSVKLIRVVCYNQLEFWHSRERAMCFYREAIRNSEGSEQERYLNILWDLEDGEMLCEDGVGCINPQKLNIDSPDGTRDYGGKIWYPKN
jgi:hypothetical protein